MYLLSDILKYASAIVMIISAIAILIQMFTSDFCAIPLFTLVGGMGVFFLSIAIMFGIQKADAVDWASLNAEYVVGQRIEAIYYVDIDGDGTKEYCTQENTKNPSFKDYCVNGPIVGIKVLDAREVLDALVAVRKPTALQTAFALQISEELGIFTTNEKGM